jgi:hypothetical protein
MDAKVNAAKFKTREDFDQFVNLAEATGLQIGLRPGVLREHLKFTPPEVSDRASEQLGKIRAAWKQQGRDPETLSGVAVQFDIDGDGKLERVPYRQLQEFAGEGVFTPDGKPYVPSPPRTLTFGQAFPQARGTVLADKPMPTTAGGDPDYHTGLLDLQRALRLTPAASGESRAQAQAEARNDFEAAVLAGEALDKLTPRFAAQFKRLGLNVNREWARVRERLLGIGARVTPESQREVEALTPEDLITRGRSALTGAPATTSTPAPPQTSREVKRTADPLVVRNPALRAAARKVLQAEIERRGQSAPITDAQIDVFLGDPHNVRLLEQGGR